MKAGAVDMAGITDTGRLRRVNQDDWHADADIGICVVADGMGGHANGAEASHLALQVLRDQLEAGCASDEPPELTIGNAIRAANAAIFQQNVAQGHSAGAGMGTTLTGLYDVNPALLQAPTGSHSLLFNVGDSRVYRFRASQLDLLTRDHTLYREWKDAGGQGIAPPRNIILRALGLFASVDIDITPVENQVGDVYLLCSDGLNDMLDRTFIQQCLTQSIDEPASVIAQRLVDAANQAGGEDNITVVIIKYLATESS